MINSLHLSTTSQSNKAINHSQLALTTIKRFFVYCQTFFNTYTIMVQTIEQAILASIESGKKIFVFGLSQKADLEILEAFKKLSSQCEEVFCQLNSTSSDLPNLSLTEMMEYLSGVTNTTADNYIAAFSKPNKYLTETYGMTLCYHNADTSSTIYSIDTLNDKEPSLSELFAEANSPLLG